MKIIYVDDEVVIELDNKDKWWLKKYFNDDELSDEDGEVEINFIKKGDIYIPDKDAVEVDYIGIFSVEEIRDIIKNSKSKIRNRYHVEIIETNGL